MDGWVVIRCTYDVIVTVSAVFVLSLPPPIRFKCSVSLSFLRAVEQPMQTIQKIIGKERLLA